MQALALLIAVLCSSFAGDSVQITVQITDNVAAQPVGVDSVNVFVRVERGVAGSPQPGDSVAVTVAKTASPQIVRLTYPLLPLWTAANQTRTGSVGVRYGRINPEGGPTLWSAWTKTSNSAWTFTRDQRAPNAPEVTGISVTGVGLN
jgi:hypothetical protein